MTLVDLTLLLAAVNSRAPMHKAARHWWEEKLNSDDRIGMTWLVMLGFIRLTTHPKILPEPLLLADAIALVDGWLARPMSRWCRSPPSIGTSSRICSTPSAMAPPSRWMHTWPASPWSMTRKSPPPMRISPTSPD